MPTRRSSRRLTPRAWAERRHQRPARDGQEPDHREPDRGARGEREAVLFVAEKRAALEVVLVAQECRARAISRLDCHGAELTRRQCGAAAGEPLRSSATLPCRPPTAGSRLRGSARPLEGASWAAHASTAVAA